MKMNEFTDLIKLHIEEYLPEDYKNCVVESQESYKNNCHLTGLSIKKNTDQPSAVTPIIYLDDILKLYNNEEIEMEDVYKEIADIRIKAKGCDIIGDEIKTINNYEKIKEYIRPRLINANMNDELLKTIPHTIKENLAIIYYIEFDKEVEQVYSVLIKNELLDIYNISLEELNRKAFENIEDDYIIEDIAEILKSITPNIEEFLPPFDAVYSRMYVVTNNKKLHGASTIFNKKCIEELRNVVKSDFYIIPSSIHEVIAVKLTADITGEDQLQSIVSEVNNTQVPQNEILSYNIYRINDKNEIELVY